jgi:hypothetical protein
MIFLICFSCNQNKKTSDLLSVTINENGLLDVYDVENNFIIIRNINAYYNNGNDVSISMHIGNNTITKTSFQDKMGKGTETVFEQDTEDGNTSLRWLVRTFNDKPVLAARLEISNHTNSSVRINRIVPIATHQDKGGILMDSSEPLQYIEMDPETWTYKRLKKLEGQGESRFVTGIATPDNKGVVIGCISVDRFRGVFEFEDQRSSSGLLSLNIYNDIDDHLLLGANQSMASEWIYIDCKNDVLTGLEEWAKITGEINNAVISNPPAVGFYTWYYYRDYVSEKIMMDNAKFLAVNKDRFPVNYVHIDWGWQRKFSSGDTIANEKFPNGLKWLAHQIKDMGFTPSIWCNPFMYTTPTAEPPLKNPEIFLKDTSGNMVEHEPIRNIMANAWGDAEYMISPGVIHALDVSNPGSYDFLKNRYNWVRSMGYDMAMMDFVIYGRHNHAAGHRLKNPNVSTFEGIRKALFAAREGLGVGGNVLGCGTIYETAVGTSNLTRISLDAVANWYCVTVASMDLILHYYMNQNLWTNYADGIFVRDKASPYWGPEGLDAEGNEIPMYLTDDEAQFYAAVTGLTQAAVMYTEDIQILPPHRQWLLSMLMPIYSNGTFRPVDLFKTTSPKTLQLVCEEGEREWIVAAGLNWTDDEDTEGLDLSLLDLDGNKQYHAFNVFHQNYIGLVNSKTLLGPINAHGVLVANLVPDLDRPQVIGSNLHISQGGVEIDEEQWDADAKILTINFNDMHGRKGDIFLHVPSSFDPSAPDNVGAEMLKDGIIMKVPLILEGKTSIKIPFE